MNDQKIVVKILEYKNKENAIKDVEILEKENFMSSSFPLEVLKNFQLGKRSEIIVAEINSIIVGYIILYDNEDTIDILKIAVKFKMKRKGIGRILLDFVKKEYAKNIFLEVRESNTIAIKFYENCNFKKISTRKNYYRDKNENAIIMVFEK